MTDYYPAYKDGVRGMARWTVTDSAGHTLVILTDAGAPISMHIEPAGKSLEADVEVVRDVRTKLGAAITTSLGREPR